MSTDNLAGVAFGLLFVVTLVVLSVKVRAPSPFQYQLFRIILSVAVAGLGTAFSTMFNIEFNNPGLGLLLRAGGPLIIFLVVYFFNPARLAPGVEPPITKEIERTQAKDVGVSAFNARLNDLFVAPCGIASLLDEYAPDVRDERQRKASHEAWQEIQNRADANHHKLVAVYAEMDHLQGLGYFGQDTELLNDIHRIVAAKMHEFYRELDRYRLTPILTDENVIAYLRTRAHDMEKHNSEVEDVQHRLKSYLMGNSDALHALLEADQEARTRSA